MNAGFIGEVVKNAREIYRLNFTEYQGHKLFDLRIYARNKMGEYVATPKGISIQLNKVDEIQELFNLAKKYLPLEP